MTCPGNRLCTHRFTFLLIKDFHGHEHSCFQEFYTNIHIFIYPGVIHVHIHVSCGRSICTDMFVFQGHSAETWT